MRGDFIREIIVEKNRFMEEKIIVICWGGNKMYFWLGNFVEKETSFWRDIFWRDIFWRDIFWRELILEGNYCGGRELQIHRL